MNKPQKNTYKQTIISGKLHKEETYWLEQLAGGWEKSVFPRDWKNSLNTSLYRMETIKFSITGNLFSRLLKLSNQSDYKLFMILAAVLTLLINKYTGNRDIIIGTPAFKQDFEAEFINTALVLRNRISDDNMTFKDLLLQVKQTVVEANDNQNYPIEELPRLLEMPFSKNKDFPLFDIVLLLENIQDKKYIEDIKTNVIFLISRESDRFEGKIEYNSILYDKPTIEWIMMHFLHLLGEVLPDVSVKMNDIEILTGKERKQLLFEFNDSKADYPKSKTIHRLFEEQVERTPDHIAVVGPAAESTSPMIYRELNEKSNRLARRLRAKGVKPDTIVGIMLERSVDMIVGLLAVLKAGGAYLPIDIHYPQKRIQYMLEDSSVDILVTHKELRKTFELKEVIEPDDKEVGNFKANNLGETSSPGNLVYVIYTSGSTGRPKGVLVEHGGLVNMVVFHQKLFGQNPGSRMSQVGNTGFDAMTFEVWPCLLNGAAMYIAGYETCLDPSKLKNWLLDNEITISFQPTVMAEGLLKEEWPESGVSLNTLIGAGDRLTRYPLPYHPFRLYNLYGPTEDTIWTSYACIEPIEKSVRERFPDIGKPVNNHQIYIISPDFKLQLIGVSGEICAGGDGVARGYLNQPELTAEKFVRNPFLLPEDNLFYRTGDLGRWLPDGKIEFLGRADHQVKIRGFRIELSEIENTLIKHKDVDEVIVTAREKQDGEKYLCAYFTADTQLEVSQLRKWSAGLLPGYMIPAYFVQLDTFPLSPNGKLDRKTLPEPGAHLEGEKITLPQDETEKALVEIWSDVLGIEKEKISTDSSFFDLGGHSLSLTSLISKIHEAFGIEFPVSQILEKPVIKEISIIIQANDIVEHPVMLLNRSTGKKIFCFPPQIAYSAVYMPLASAINEYSWYGLTFIEDGDRLEQYVDILTNLQPEGPFVLLGYSSGTRLAFEVANALKEHNRDVSDIIVFDSSYNEDIDTSITDEKLQEQCRQIEEFIITLNLEFIKDKVLNKAAKYMKYFEKKPKFGLLDANVHLVLSQKYWGVDWKHCWDKFTTKTSVIYRGFGEHEQVFSTPFLDKNVEIFRKILDGIENRL